MLLKYEVSVFYERDEDDDNITVLVISLPDSDKAILVMLGYFVDQRPLQKLLESLRI